MPFHKRILFVDDEHAIRETLSRILKKYGFNVTVATTVPVALHEVETREFDLLLCDLNIERESDGLDVIRAMRKVNPDCVIFILTAYPGLDSAVQGINVGVDGYFTKPTNADALLAALAEKLFARQIKNSDYKVHSDLQLQNPSEQPGTASDGAGIHPTVSVLIVDDVAEWRAQVRKLLENQPGWQIIAEACDGLQAVKRAAELSPDLVLLDIGMPGLSGLEAAKQIQQISPQSKIVFLTQESAADVRSAALDTGGHGYVLKANAGSELLPTITGVLRDGHQADHLGASVRGLSRR